jgi:hypothetical protein
MPFNPNQDPPDGGIKFQMNGGYIIAGMNEDMCCVIHELYVNPEDRRAKSEGLWPMIVECSPKNEAGMKFYEAIGMRQVSIVYQED